MCVQYCGDPLSSTHEPAHETARAGRGPAPKRAPGYLHQQGENPARGKGLGICIPHSSPRCEGRDDERTVPRVRNALDRRTYWRNIIGFWILGLRNNFSYIIMLSAAHNILPRRRVQALLDRLPHATAPGGPVPLSQGVARIEVDVLTVNPSPLRYRVLFCCFSAVTSFIVVSFSVVTWISLLGVVFASVSSGLGEYTFLSLTAHFQMEVVWGRAGMGML
ncbi:LOW QUALITY PROTEIN: battenin [Mobula birostris]|uniref:LOW QUALITY PROTEIN: battenin n=1 Tax=Mobula birostris TaxID=1983395 RepID=UPI003B27CB98